MLVLHPSSRCDVCLETYTQDSLARSPHAVPCGHVFCRTCLLAIIPPNCPLCRKPYLPDRVKKLIVDKLEDMDDQLLGDSRRENELLRRLMVCWDESDDRLVDLTREVDLWLQDRTAAHPALKKARGALAEYQKLKSRRERDKLTIKALKERERVTTFERDETQAIEQSLLSHISQLEAKLAESENNRQVLETQVARYKLKNPLPQPPGIPVSLEQLTTSVATPRASGPMSLYTVPETGPSSSRRQSQNNGSVVQPDPRFITPFYAPITESQPSSQNHPTEGERDRKGKRRARESNGRHSSAGAYANGRSFIPSSSHPNGVLSEDERSVIVPGAVAPRRIVPPKHITTSNTPFPREDTSHSRLPEGSPNSDTGAGLNPYSLASLYIGEYVNGYGEGYNAATVNPPNSHSSEVHASSYGWIAPGQDNTPREAQPPLSSSLSRNSTDSHPQPVDHGPWHATRTSDRENESGEERLVYNVNGHGHRSSSHADSNNNYNPTQSSLPLASRNNENGTSYSRPQRSHRRRTSGFIPGHETDVESARRTRDDLPPTQRPNSVSVPSWNVHPPIPTTATTIATASNVNGGTRGAQSAGSGTNELGLSSFGPESMYANPPGDTPRSTLSSLGLHSFPLREDDEIVMERLPSANAESGRGATIATQQRTPRQRGERYVSFDRRPTFIGGPNSTTPVGQGQATIATSNVSAIATTSVTINETTNASRSIQRRSGRHTTNHDYAPHARNNTSTSARSSSSALVPTSAVPAPPAVTISPTAMEDSMHLTVAEMPRPLPRTPPGFRNALGLQLEAGERAENSTPVPGISAPMPVVSAERFLRSWSRGDSG